MSRNGMWLWLPHFQQECEGRRLAPRWRLTHSFLWITASCVIHVITWTSRADVATLGRDIRQTSDSSVRISFGQNQIGVMGGISSENIHVGIEFDSLQVYGNNIFHQLYEDTQRFGTFIGTNSEFLNALALQLDSYSSEIELGWETRTTNGVVHWSHAAGEAGVDYEPFLSSFNHTAITRFRIPWECTDWNRNGVFSTREGDGIRFVEVNEYLAHVGFDGMDEHPAYASFAPAARPAIPQPILMLNRAIAARTLWNSDGAGFTYTKYQSYLAFTILPASSDPQYFIVDYELRNPFTNATVDSYDVNLSLLNSELGVDQDNVHATHRLFILGDASAGRNVADVGWFGSLLQQGVSIEHIVGAPMVDYDVWQPTGTQPDELIARISIDKDLFDHNSNGWSQADVDLGIDSFLGLDIEEDLLGVAYSGTSSFAEYGYSLQKRQLVLSPAIELSATNLVAGITYWVQTKTDMNDSTWRIQSVFAATNSQQVIWKAFSSKYDSQMHIQLRER